MTTEKPSGRLIMTDAIRKALSRPLPGDPRNRTYMEAIVLRLFDIAAKGDRRGRAARDLLARFVDAEAAL